jgi:hypothetical protein
MRARRRLGLALSWLWITSVFLTDVAVACTGESRWAGSGSAVSRIISRPLRRYRRLKPFAMNPFNPLGGRRYSVSRTGSRRRFTRASASSKTSTFSLRRSLAG